MNEESAIPAQVAKPVPATAPAAASVSEPPAPADPQEGPSRRTFLVVAWAALAAGMGALATVTGRFLFPNVLFEPPSTFKAGRPDDYAAGKVDERWKDKYQVWIVRDDSKIYALLAICTHLGCPPNWLDGQNKFKCPCHGSGYYKSGVNFEGPTPRPLERLKLSVSPDDGQIVVDKAVRFRSELGQWTDPQSYIEA